MVELCLTKNDLLVNYKRLFCRTVPTNVGSTPPLWSLLLLPTKAAFLTTLTTSSDLIIPTSGKNEEWEIADSVCLLSNLCNANRSGGQG
jgi:hypothetical protein